MRISYDFSHADASNLSTIPAGSPIPTPKQLPNVFNELQQLHIDARHRLTSKLAATFSYLYEPLKIFDYAFDPSVVNGIVQPSSLVMGYVYRPYTAHSVVFGLQYALVDSHGPVASGTWRICMRRTLVTGLGCFVFALIASAGIAQAQDAALVKKGQEVYTAQKCSVCHAIAGKGGKSSPLDGVGTKLTAADITAWIVTPVEAAAKAKSTKTAHAGEVRQAARGRYRRDGRLHAESEVAGASCRAARRSSAIRSRSPAR